MDLFTTISDLYTKYPKLSDVHLASNRPIYFRVDAGNLEKYSDFIIDYADLVFALNEADLLKTDRNEIVVENKDASYNTSKFSARVNIFKENQGIAASFRIIRKDIPNIKDLLIPNTVRDFVYKEHGLLAFSGATGSGKSTTIAALLQVIHQDKRECKHIITLEDPIEYHYGEGYSLISQREIGTHCNSFAEGLREALREDPDIIVVGEMRDADTIRTALAASETGHLVLTTLHAANTIEAIDRFLQYFQQKDIEIVRSQLANAFEAIIAQKLIPSKIEGRKKVPAFEIITKNIATTNLIRTGTHHGIVSYFNKQDGMINFEDSISALKVKGLI